MKKVFKRKASWISCDGKEFKTKKACERYEEEHLAYRPSLLERKIKDLEEIEHSISCHKHLHWEFYEERMEFVWYCGQKHQQALKELAETKNSQELRGLDRLIAIGKAAQEVKSWKDLEKKAYADLMKLRLRKDMLRDEITNLRKEEQ